MAGIYHSGVLAKQPHGVCTIAVQKRPGVTPRPGAQLPSRLSHRFPPRRSPLQLHATSTKGTGKTVPSKQNPSTNGGNPDGITVGISNEEGVTVITIEGKGDQNLLMSITSTLSAMGLLVSSASIDTREGGLFNDVFRVTDKDGNVLPKSQFEEITAKLMAIAAGGTAADSNSTLPLIYGIAAAAEVERLRPLSEKGDSNSAAALELVAAEMSQAAADLVAVEREIMSIMKSKDKSDQALHERETRRNEAAILLERRMAAMEAAIKSLRAPPLPEKPTEEKRAEGADLRFGSLGGGTGVGAGCGDGFEIFFQAFNWDSCKEKWYKKLSEQLRFIADSGVTTLWLPPPTDSVSPQGYLPRDIYNLNTPYGTEGDLRELNRSAHDLGLKTVADIVVNHRCASAQGDDGKWNKFGGRLPWDSSVITSDSADYGGRGSRSTGQVYAAAPNIDHTQERVRKDYTEWLLWLRNSIGFDGWRLDFVIGYSGDYTKEYVNGSVPELAFGEYWDTCAYDGSVLQYNQDAHRQRIVNWIDSTGGTAGAFDFTTKGILQEAVGRNERWRLVDPKGKPPGVIGMWPSRAITFIDNHDTGSSLQHWPFPGRHLEEGYCYILTHPGSPCIFYDHFFSGGLGDKIRDLIQVRKQNKINARSKVVVAKATGDVYAATIDDKVHMKIGPGEWSPRSNNIPGKWERSVSGNGFCVWENKQ